MAWTTEMVTMLRILVDDIEEAVYNDAKLEQVLAYAAFQVCRELPFDYVVAIATPTISPDPTDSSSKDDSFTNLVCLKAACLIDRSTAMTAAGRSIAVRDGGSSVDLTGVFGAKLRLLEQGWCAVYADAKLEYQANAVAVAGAAIMTPFRYFAYGDYGSRQVYGEE